MDQLKGIEELNLEQKQAVENEDGPQLIVAGAGTGKTRVITEKMKWLVERGLKPDEILALTFTEKAAEEMVGRLDTIMPLGYEEPWVSTFHRFGERILKQEALEIGLDPSYRIMTQPEQWLLVKEHLFEFELSYYRPLGNPNKFIGALIKLFARAGDENVSAQEIREYAKSIKGDVEETEVEKLLEVAGAYEKYNDLKLKESVLDFGDLISWCLKLFAERGNVLAKYQRQFKHILVDEFQDTNYAQYQLIKMLAPVEKQPNLTVVGDDSQSIYRFRGAAISNILNFMRDYPKAKQIVLTKNYRSVQPILDGAYKLIKQNDPETLEAKLGISKNLTSQRQDKIEEQPVVVEMETAEEEVEWVMKKIYELLAKGYNYKDVAIVARANSQLEAYVSGLKQLSLPYRRVGNRGLFDQEEIRVMINFMRVIVNPENNVDLFGYLYMEELELNKSLILKKLAEAKRNRVSLYELIVEDEAFSRAVELIRQAQENIDEQISSQILFNFVNESGYLKRLVEKESLENALKLKNLNLFFRYLRGFEEKTSLGVVGLVEMLDDLMEAGENPQQAEIEDIDAITLTTAHSAKGLEFGVVFMVSLVAGRFPAYGRRDPIELPTDLFKENLPEEDKTAEERRLFYVGMTRARDRLFLTWAKDYGGVRNRKASGFLAETGFGVKKMKANGQLTLLGIKPEEPPIIYEGEQEYRLDHLSYSQIDTYKACPLKFKYRYILQIPAEPHHALSFGRSIHETLKEFHQFEQAGREVKREELLAIYEKHFVKEGYESAQHMKDRYEAGRMAMNQYHSKCKELLGNAWRLEQSFKLVIGGIPLIGKIDRIDKNGQAYEIIDYKTGSAGRKGQADKDEQLSIYALAAHEALGIEAERLSLYFIESNEKEASTRTLKQMEKKRADLEEMVEEIKSSKFEPKPGNPFPCGFCEYRKICPFADRG